MVALYQYVGSSRLPSQPDDLFASFARMLKNVLELDMEIKSLKESEKEHLLNVLIKTHWDLEKTSRLLKISLNRLKSKIKEYDISLPDPQGS